MDHTTPMPATKGAVPQFFPCSGVFVMRLAYFSGVVALAATTVVPATVAAQPGGVAPACNIDPNSPKELAVLSLTFQSARSAQSPEARKKSLMNIMKELDTKPERFAKNLPGYNYMLAQALTLWGVEPGVGFMPTRGTLGFVAMPEQPYDIVAHLDSAFTSISTTLPNCATEVGQLRQNDVWLALTRRALDASNAGQLDSADFYASRSLRLSKESPYPHYVMGNVANVRNDRAAAMGHWKAVIASAGTDTSYRELKNSSLYYLSMSQLEAAQAAKGDEAIAIAKEAAANLKTLFEINPDGQDAGNIMSSWADALRLAGDSASVPTVYARLVAAPDKFSDFTLTMGGVIATRNNKTEDARVMFEAAVAKNPSARDALRNLTATYYAKDDFKKMFEPTAKLVAIDPNNFDAWMMYAYAYQGLSAAAKVPAEKKALVDSLVKYRTIADGLPAKVEVTNFQRTASTAQLALSLEQQAAKPGTYSVTVEFLDAKGDVVGSDTQSVGPINKGETKSVTFKAAAAGVIGYRYQPIK